MIGIADVEFVNAEPTDITPDLGRLRSPRRSQRPRELAAPAVTAAG
jgi:hypothetical protein